MAQTEQINNIYYRRAALSILGNIAEGCEIKTIPEYLRSLRALIRYLICEGKGTELVNAKKVYILLS